MHSIPSLSSATYGPSLLLLIMLAAFATFYVIEGFQLARRVPSNAVLLGLLQRRSLTVLLVIAAFAGTVLLQESRPEKSPPVHIVHSAPTPQPTPVAAAPTTPPANNLAYLFEDNTVFAEPDASHKAHLDQIKPPYEQLLVTYYILEKCAAAEPAQLTLLETSLTGRIAESGGTAEDKQNIFSAAQGMFRELYEHTNCGTLNIPVIKQRFTDSLASLKP